MNHFVLKHYYFHFLCDCKWHKINFLDCISNTYIRVRSHPQATQVNRKSYSNVYKYTCFVVSLNERENSGFRWTYPQLAALVRSKSLCFSSFDSPTSIDAYFRASKRAKLIVLPEFHHCRRRLATQLSIALRNKVQVTFDWYQGGVFSRATGIFGRRPRQLRP